MRRRGRNIAIWIMAVVVVIVSAVVVWSVIEMRRGAAKLLDRGPSVPTPSAADAAAMPLTRDGVRVTVKQRGNAWLPGGKLKLHVGDITGGQALVSVTDEDERVVPGQSPSQRARSSPCRTWKSKSSAWKTCWSAAATSASST